MRAEFNSKFVFDLRPPFSSSFSNVSSTRDSVVSILGFFPGLSCKQITTLVFRARSEPISQQAIFKMLNSLVADGVLVKDERKYFLNSEWLKQAKKFFETVQERSSINQSVVLV